ncbi:MAG: hypothetical protein GY765_14540 [bacterium]|nr:hypothetical protein [bacterium]
MNDKKKTNILRSLCLPVLLLVCLLGMSCKTSDSTETSTDTGISFSNIYDRPHDLTYTAVDIKHTSDGGYIILGNVEMEEARPYILRLNADGSAIWDTTFEQFAGYTTPTADILIGDDAFYFFCTFHDDENPLPYTALLRINDKNRQPERVSMEIEYIDSSLILPVNAKMTPEGEILFHAMNVLETKTAVFKSDQSGYIIWDIPPFKFDSSCAGEFPVLDKRFNFFAIQGSEEGNDIYWLNGFYPDNMYPYCFASTPIDSEDGTMEHHNAFFSDTIPFIAMDFFGDTVSGALLNGSVISLIINEPLQEGLEGSNIPQSELNESKPVLVKHIIVNGNTIAFFAGSARNNQIVLYAYDFTTGDYITKKYFGSTHSYEATALIETTDTGLAIVGTTYVAGQLGRLCLFKLSTSDLEGMVK